jgi:hypothetical protein
MGRSEEATASIGIKILLSDLVEQLNETNTTLIREMLYNGRIEDENGFYNETYMRIIYYDDCNLPENHLVLKQHLLEQFKKNGSLLKSKYSNEVKSDLHEGTLLERYLLVPVEQIVSNERWGYNREGTNAMSVPFINTFTEGLVASLEKYKDIKHYKVVFMITQNAG